MGSFQGGTITGGYNSPEAKEAREKEAQKETAGKEMWDVEASGRIVADTAKQDPLAQYDENYVSDDPRAKELQAESDDIDTQVKAWRERQAQGDPNAAGQIEMLLERKANLSEALKPYQVNPRQQGLASLTNVISNLENIIQTTTDPNVKANASAQLAKAKAQLGVLQSGEDSQEKLGIYQGLLSRAQGEGLDDLASVRGLEEGYDRAEAAASSALGGARGSRSQALLQARQAELAQQETREREMAKYAEVLAAAQAASTIGNQLSQEFQTFSFNQADLDFAITEAQNGLTQAGLDANAMVERANLLADYNKKQADAASEDQFFSQLLSTGLTLGGMGIGFVAGGPAGAVAGGTVGGSLGRSF